MPRSIFCIPPLATIFIIFWACSNCASRRLTSCTVTPAPAATRRLREAFKSSGRRRSAGVIELMMPSRRRTVRSSACAACAARASSPGSLSSRPCIPPILRIWPSCALKSSRSNPLPALTFLASRPAASRSTCRCASSISVSMSPMPRMRDAMRSGWKTSSPSSFSATPAYLIGAPVTWRTDSAAPPRASPSSLVSTTPGERKRRCESLGRVHRVLTLHRVDDEQRFDRAQRRMQRRDLAHHRRRRSRAVPPCRR